MADRKSNNAPSPDAPDADRPSGRRTRSIVALALVTAAIAGTAYVLGGRSSSGATLATSDATVVTTPPSETIDEIVELDALNVNLTGGHYLRVAVAIGLTGTAEASSGHGGSDTPSIATAPASDLVVTTFAGRDMAVLATVDGREAARRDLHDALVAFYGDDVVSVLFTEFVMQ